MSLVTGGRGVLGRAVVDALRSAGPRVRMLDVREPALRDGLVELVTGGVTDPKTTREAVDGCAGQPHSIRRSGRARPTMTRAT